MLLFLLSDFEEIVWFSFFFKLHSCAHLRHASLYWLLKCFKKCLDISLNYSQPKMLVFCMDPQMQHSLILCYLSELLFQEPSMYCMKTWLFSLSLNKLQGNWTSKALFCLPGIYFSNNFFTTLWLNKVNKSIFYHC